MLPFVFARRDRLAVRNPVLQSYGLAFPLLILFFVSLRAFIYCDVIAYYKTYDRLPIGWSIQNIKKIFTEPYNYNSWEYGFLLLMWLCKNTFNNYFFFQFVISTLTLYIFALVVKRHSSNIFLSFICLFIFYGLVVCFNTIRNALQMMLFLYSLKSLQTKKYGKYLLINLFGSLFHGAAFIYLLFTPLFLIRFNRKLVLYLFIVGNIVFLAQIKWMRPLALSAIELLPAGIWKHRFEYYFVNAFQFSYGLTIGYLERMITFIMFFFCFDKKKDDTILKNRVFNNAFYVYMLLYLFCSEYVIVFQRICGLLVFSYWFLYPFMYVSLKKKYSKMVFMILFVLYAVLRLISGSNTADSRYENALLPHHNFYQYESFLISNHVLQE